jgi:hypothetical protein
VLVFVILFVFLVCHFEVDGTRDKMRVSSLPSLPFLLLSLVFMMFVCCV